MAQEEKKELAEEDLDSVAGGSRACPKCGTETWSTGIVGEHAQFRCRKCGYGWYE